MVQVKGIRGLTQRFRIERASMLRYSTSRFSSRVAASRAIRSMPLTCGSGSVNKVSMKHSASSWLIATTMSYEPLAISESVPPSSEGAEVAKLHGDRSAGVGRAGRGHHEDSRGANRDSLTAEASEAPRAEEVDEARLAVEADDPGLASQQFLLQDPAPRPEVDGGEIGDAPRWALDDVGETILKGRHEVVLLRPQFARGEAGLVKKAPEGIPGIRIVVPGSCRLYPGVDPNEDDVQTRCQVIGQREESPPHAAGSSGVSVSGGRIADSSSLIRSRSCVM